MRREGIKEIFNILYKLYFIGIKYIQRNLYVTSLSYIILFM